RSRSDREIKAQLAWAAPWKSVEEREGLLALARENPYQWTPKALGDALQVTLRERAFLGLNLMHPIDAPEPKELHHLTERERQTQRRREDGVQPRARYLANSIERTKPWLREGISRATWYRRR